MTEKNRLEIIFRIPHAIAHSFSMEEGLIFSSKNMVFAIQSLHKPTPKLLGNIPWSGLKKLCHIRIIDRALKNSLLQVTSFSEGRFLVSTGKEWWSIGPNGKVKPIKPFSSTRPMNRGVCFVRRTGNVYVAGYNQNPERGPVSIYRSSDLETFEVAWEFPAKEIRHVHAILEDPEDLKTLWVLTGDWDHESNFYVTRDDFKTLHRIYNAGQMSRATDMIFHKGRLIWGMDSPVVTSHIIQASRENPQDAKPVHELPGPAYYMTQNKAGGLYLGTTAEPGPAVKDKLGHLIGTKPDGSWSEILTLKKDFFPQFGIFYFPKGVLPENFLVYSQRALTPYEGTMTIARDTAWKA